ncbi:MAG: M3 family metallopeptidase [Burkholderiaceae bacterium]|jgi:peptidyl-dipeptidase Dcp|nr:M3 family metallopeptidase [Burkholderiaceae bacterium]
MNDLASSAQLNPLLAPWTGCFGLPPFAQVQPEHFVPAFEVALAAHRAQIEAIASSAAPPDFDNTVAALDASGRTLAKIEALFRNLTASHTSEALQAVERAMAPRLAAHHSDILLDARLFARINALHAQRASLALSPEQLQLLTRLHLDFVTAGARLSPAARARIAEIVTEHAELTTRFSQNVLHDEATHCLWLHSEADLAGLPAFLRAAAKQAAEQRGDAAAWAISLSRSMMVPFLTFSTRRDLRQQGYALWKARGEGGGTEGGGTEGSEHDNRPIARRILALRNEQARLHGHASYASFALVDRMAGTPAAVRDLLMRVWTPAKARAIEERTQLEAIARGDGITAIEPWDWRFYAEQLRQQRYQLDDAQLKPYFALDRMLAAAFDVAGRLFGLQFIERPEIETYHPDVRAFEVRRTDVGQEKIVGLFLSDNFARPSKRSGAWMSAYRWQNKLAGGSLPIIVNNNNFAKAPAGEPTLLSFDDVRTLFHEFGHGLHGLLSDVTYDRLSGTKVLRDFVELPSQIYEHWALESAVLKQHATHVHTGAPIPDALLERIRAARSFNQGFETVGYTACALLDLALHEQTDARGVDIAEFEQAELARLGLPAGTSTYHRLPHFQHLFSSSAYAAGYYVYMWAEVLDADGFGAFEEAGDPFDAETAAKLHRHIYAVGGSVDPMTTYRAFRGRDPQVEPLLVKRGLMAAA